MAQDTPRLVTLLDPRSPAAEAYRTLRSNLIFASLDEPLVAVVITSAAPDDGKSTTLANLAVTLAQGGKSAIIVDADLRRPAQHKIWELPNDVGLADAMQSEAKTPKLNLQSTPVENLQVLTSGLLTTTSPADMVGSSRMDAVIEVLKKKADIVLFDTPPITAVTDAALLASKVDAALLVIRAGGTRREMALQAKALLEKSHARILGTVLNDAPGEGGGKYYGSDAS